jgi:hypothetical protein
LGDVCCLPEVHLRVAVAEEVFALPLRAGGTGCVAAAITTTDGIR